MEASFKVDYVSVSGGILRLARLALLHSLFLLLAVTIKAQDSSLSLEMCHTLLEENYPLSSQRGLIAESCAAQRRTIFLSYMPQVSVGAEARYQSDVTRMELDYPGLEIPSARKDQYQTYLDVYQSIWDGGTLASARRQVRTKAAVAHEEVGVQMHKLHSQVDDLFFGILLLERQLELQALLEGELERNQKRVRHLISNGLANEVDNSLIEIEIRRAAQQRRELESARETQLHSLSLLLDTTLDTATRLQEPPRFEHFSYDSIVRPELALFSARTKHLKEIGSTLNAQIYPQIGLFARLGYGNPGLNMLSDKFEPYHIAGVRFQWNFGNFYSLRSKRQMLGKQIEIEELAAESFRRGVVAEIEANLALRRKCEALLKEDVEIIRLRESVRNAMELRVENGTVSISEHLETITQWQEARLTMMVHEMLLLRADYQLQKSVSYK